jgi:hypothetical protein
MLSESGSLILSTSSTVNPCTINAQKTQFTFSNIDLKNVLGEMWDKYDIFALKPVSLVTQGTITLVSGSTYAMVCYNLAGLDWTNVKYDTAFNSKKYVPVVFSASSSSSSIQTVVITNTGQSFNFRKGQRFVDLEFSITIPDTIGIQNFGVIAAGNIYNDAAFHFVIEPVIEGEMNECAFFGFNTNQTITSQVGRAIYFSNTEYNYPSFDMRDLCRDFWDKHDDFEIMMSSYNTVGVGTLSGNARTMLIQMNGLNFVNNGTQRGSSTGRLQLNAESPIMGGIVHATAASGHQVANQVPFAPIQFKKDKDNVNLTITFRNYDNNGNYNGVSLTNYRAVISFYIKPIYKVEKATLCINPFPLTTTQTNLGVRNSAYTQFTINNIDLRSVCRSMWDKYKKFNIFLTTTVSTNGSSNANNGSFILQMEGLDFINQTAYITASGQTQVATLGAILMGNGAPYIGGHQCSYLTTFYKTADVVSLTFDAEQLAPTPTFTNSPLENMYIFTIVGVPEDEGQAKQLKENWMPIF